MRRRRGRSDGESKQQEHKGKDKEMEMRGKMKRGNEGSKGKTWKRSDKQAKSIRETNLLSIQILPLVHNIFV